MVVYEANNFMIISSKDVRIKKAKIESEMSKTNFIVI